MTTDNGTVLEKKTKTVLGPPPKMYNVVIHDSPIVDMVFVVGMLTAVFNMNRETATNKMMDVHKSQRTLIGPFVRDIAEMRKEQCVVYVAKATDERNRDLKITAEPAP